jgi:hypothetical protein
MGMDIRRNVSNFLEKNIPQHDSMLLGCRADDEVNVHECCEYNIIALSDLDETPQSLLYFDEFEGNNSKYKRTFQVRILSARQFHNNNFIKYSDFVYFPRKFLKSTEFNHFGKKNENLRKTFRFEIRREVLGNVYDLTFLLNTLSKEVLDEKTISFELKMVSLRTLRNYIHFYLGKEHRPSHLKNQINSVIQTESIRIRERIDKILEFIGMHKANISALRRSEKSLDLLMRNVQSPTKKLILHKVEFLKEKSMYVDGIFLIYNYLLDNFQDQEQKTSYQQLLRRTADIDNKDKMTLQKEILLLMEYNKLLI